MEFLIIILLIIFFSIAIGTKGKGPNQNEKKYSSDSSRTTTTPRTSISTGMNTGSYSGNSYSNTRQTEQKKRDDSSWSSRDSQQYGNTTISGNTKRTAKRIPTIDQLKIKADEQGINYITEINFEVKGLYYRGKEARLEAERLVRGDVLRLEPEPDNPQDENAIRVYTERGIWIGYVSRECAEEFSIHQKDFIDCYVRRIKDGYDTVYVKAIARYYGDFFVCDEEYDSSCTVYKLHDYMAPAIELKKGKEYDKAALSFMQASEKIKDIGEKLEAYSQACICFRKTKDYKQEISTIHLALSLLNTSTHTSKPEFWII